MTDTPKREVGVASPSSQRNLVDRIAPYVPDIKDGESPGRIFRAWLSRALRNYKQSAAARAFAPYNAYFMTQVDFVSDFINFVRSEIDSTRAGDLRSDLFDITCEVLQSELADAVRSIAVSLDNENTVDQYIFELFEIFYNLRPEDALGWAALIIRDSNLNEIKAYNSAPLPLELYWRTSNNIIAGKDSFAFFSALLDWCVKHPSEPGVVPVALDIIPAVFNAMQDSLDVSRAEKQLQFIISFTKKYGGKSLNGEMTRYWKKNDILWGGSHMVRLEPIKESLDLFIGKYIDTLPPKEKARIRGFYCGYIKSIKLHKNITLFGYILIDYLGASDYSQEEGDEEASMESVVRQAA